MGGGQSRGLADIHRGVHGYDDQRTERRPLTRTGGAQACDGVETGSVRVADQLVLVQLHTPGLRVQAQAPMRATVDPRPNDPLKRLDEDVDRPIDVIDGHAVHSAGMQQRQGDAGEDAKGQA